MAADYIGHFTAVEAGDIAIASIGWDTTAKDMMKEGWDSGEILNMGNPEIIRLAVKLYIRFPSSLRNVGGVNME